jgi:amidase
VAVATGEADVALGSDTGGSVRVPAACCGVTGLKTTYGRISLHGVWPLAPSLDTIGPLGRTVRDVALGMSLLEPGFVAAPSPARRIGRLRTSGLPAIEAAIDDALHRAELEVVPIELPGWDTGNRIFTTIYFAELWEVDHHLLERDADGLGEDITRMLGMADLFRHGIEEVREAREAWRNEVLALFDQVEVLALPTLPILPPRLDDLVGDVTAVVIDITRHTSVFNAAGNPCTAQPVPMTGSAVPASLQLVGPLGAEELLIPTASLIESGAGGTSPV